MKEEKPILNYFAPRPAGVRPSAAAAAGVFTISAAVGAAMLALLAELIEQPEERSIQVAVVLAAEGWVVAAVAGTIFWAILRVRLSTRPSSVLRGFRLIYATGLLYPLPQMTLLEMTGNAESSHIALALGVIYGVVYPMLAAV